MKNNIRHLLCPKCHDTATITDWSPQLGFDPRQREFKCEKCHYVFYACLSPVKPDQPVFPTFTQI